MEEEAPLGKIPLVVLQFWEMQRTPYYWCKCSRSALGLENCRNFAAQALDHNSFQVISRFFATKFHHIHELILLSARRVSLQVDAVGQCS